MKVICIGQNYKSVTSKRGEGKPLVSLKPDSAILKGGKPFFIPDFASEFKFEGELVFHVCRLGKNISERFAHRYYDQVTVGMDLAAQDLLNEAKDKRMPWDISKGFDGSAVLGDFVPTTDLDLNNLRFRLSLNHDVVQRGSTEDMIWSIDQIIAYVSQFYTLKIGDLIYTGTPEGAGALQIGQRFDGYIEDKQVLQLDIR